VGEIHSFDVFDTALIRRVAAPSDAFRTLALRLLPLEARARRPHFIEEFVATRMAAERAVSTHASGQCTLAEIWSMLRRMMPGLPPGCGPDDELEEERRLLYANPHVVSRIDAARRAGRRIVFVSDTYLPADFVRGMLLEMDVARREDGFYISSEHGATKSSGELFRLMLRMEAAAPHAISHWGDRPIDDVQVPARLGIRASLSTESALATVERRLLAPPFSRSPAASRLVGEMRRGRLESASSEDTRPGLLVSSLLGPLVLAWAGWTLAQARHDGVRRLYFVSRDGFLAWHAAKAIATRFGDIECRYLHLSRQSVLLASASEPSADGMPWLRRTFERPSLGAILARLDLAFPEHEAVLRPLSGSEGARRKLHTEQQWSLFWQLVASDPMRSRVLENIRRRRESTVRYLQASGLLDEVPWALVDVGWYLSVQAGIQRLLRAAGSSVPARGYYLGLRSDRAVPSERGDAAALFYDDPLDKRSLAGGHPLFARVTALEHILGWAPHGTVQGYAGAGEECRPECQAIPVELSRRSNAVRDAVTGFSTRNADIAVDIAEDAMAAGIIERLVREWFEHPTADAIAAVRELTVSEEHDNANARKLIRAMSLKDALNSCIPGRIRNAIGIPATAYDWPEASAEASGAVTRELLRWRRRLVAIRSKAT
jgi:hypothetical protein